ncbi:hypothetical protein EPO33_03980 [Patescibacteria group bacterium]|nr:MAG: hypothetical protein EPO33_03980 [Patescibacteria group bacterium]
MRRVLIIAILLVLAAGGVLFFAVRPDAPALPATQPDTASGAAAEAFDVDVDEIIAQETLNAESDDGAELDDLPDDGTLLAEEQAFGSLDLGMVAPQ